MNKQKHSKDKKKTCPHCQMLVDADATKCPHCGASLV